MTGTAAALFDVDGTLPDTTYLHVMAGGRPCARPIARCPQRRSIEAWAWAWAPTGCSPTCSARTAITSTAHDAFYAQYAHLIAPFDGAAELLRACAARGWTVVLASSASRLELDALRSRLDAEDVIAAATSSDDVEATKPAPDVVERALK